MTWLYSSSSRPLAAEASRDFLTLDAREVGGGSPVGVTGHSASTWRPTTEAGKVIGRATLALAESRREKSEVLILDIPLKRGASGSPVYLPTGVVIGVVSRQNPSNPEQTVAVPIHPAIELLNQLGVRWHAGQ